MVATLVALCVMAFVMLRLVPADYVNNLLTHLELHTALAYTGEGHRRWNRRGPEL